MRKSSLSIGQDSNTVSFAVIPLLQMFKLVGVKEFNPLHYLPAMSLLYTWKSTTLPHTGIITPCLAWPKTKQGKISRKKPGVQVLQILVVTTASDTEPGSQIAFLH